MRLRGKFLGSGTGRKRGNASCYQKDHFTVDGTLLEHGVLKSFCPKDGKDAHAPDRRIQCRFPRGKTTNDTHQSTTDPRRSWPRKDTGRKPTAFTGHVLMENRNGMVVDVPLLKQQPRQSVKLRWTAEGVHGSRRVTLGCR